jgi:mRNA interferase HigB
MIVMHSKTVREYGKANAQAAQPLAEWYAKVEAADWATFAQLRGDIGPTDLISGDRFIFNIGGNKYRLLAVVLFKVRTVLIRGIFTHAEYSKLTKDQLLTL